MRRGFKVLIAVAGLFALTGAAFADEGTARLGFAPPPSVMPSMSESFRGFDGETKDGSEFSADVMSANAAMAPLLSARPDEDLILCVAGCGKQPAVVYAQLKAPPKVQSVVQLVPTLSPLGGASGRPGVDSIVCLAGCAGTPGLPVNGLEEVSSMPTTPENSLVEGKLQALADRLLRHEGTNDTARAPAPAPVMRTWLSGLARTYLLGQAMTAAH